MSDCKNSKHFINAKITCPCFIEGRHNAHSNKPLRIQKPNESSSEYQSYSKGYAGYKAFTDNTHNIINANLNWTPEMKKSYDTNMDFILHKFEKKLPNSK